MSISRRQLTSLFICSLVPWTAGNGLIPLLPLYARQLGANDAVAGYYLAISYLAIALGALSAGWISGRIHRHKLPLIIASSVGIPAAWLMGYVSTVWALTALTAILWFTGGMGLSLISILTGLSAGENERGKIFGILAVTGGLGALVGNLGTGWLVERWGYTAMFDILAIFLALSPLTALFLEEKEVQQPRLENTPGQKLPGLGKSFYLLFTASILASITGFFIVLIRSIMMSNLKFSPLEISSTGAIGGLISIPFPFLMGWLSDRIGRKTFLFVGYLTTFTAIVLLAFSKELWNFWVVLSLQGIATGSGGIGNALVTDLVRQESVGKGLAVFSSAAWIGGVIGFAVAGYTLQNLGFVTAFIIGGCLVMVASGLLVPIRAKPRKLAKPDTASA